MRNRLLLMLFLWWNGPFLSKGHLRRPHEEELSSQNHRQLQPEHPPDQKVPLEMKMLHKNYQAKRSDLIESLKREYGVDYFDGIFLDDTCVHKSDETTVNVTCTIGRTTFLHGSSNSVVAWKKMVRKMKINILQHSLDHNLQDFVWATAGNSLAAGHGNFFYQQYTMKIAEKARNIMLAAGLNLVTRPFARGGDTSAPEVAACAKEIFGTDIDLITWDYAMTDGKAHWRTEFFAHRVHVLPNHPVMLMLNAGTDPARKELVEHLTDQGMVVLRQDEVYLMEQQFKMPDSKGKSDDELEHMPSLLRNYRCGYAIENGVPCGKFRFTHNGTCDERKNQVPWHMGWKKHAFLGTVYTLFLVELLDDALYELDTVFTLEGKELDPQAEYNKLVGEEMADFKEFEEEATLMYHHKFNVHDDVTPFELYRERTYCHTANFPAMSRLEGFVFNNENKRGLFNYNHGRTIKYWRTHPDASNGLELTYIPEPRETKGQCSHVLSIDRKDFFLAHGRHGEWQSITIPNDMELKHYGDHTPKGIVAVCVSACGSECAGSKQMNADTIKKKEADFMVNGELVDSVIPFEDCYILTRTDGSIHWPAKDGSKQYTVSVKINVYGKWMEFNSFVLW